MTDRDELMDEVNLRQLLEKRQSGLFKSLDDGKRATRDMIERKKEQALKIARVLAGEIETLVLTEKKQQVWSEMFLAKMSEPGPDEEALFAGLRKKSQTGA